MTIESTVMIPAYNVGRFLAQTLESVLRQIDNNVEVLVIDDGSNDDTLEIARYYQRPNQHMRVLDQTNHGTGYTRNRLLDESKGEILFGLDGDDIFQPEAVEEVTKTFQRNPEIGFVYTDQIEIDETGKVIGKRNRYSCDRFFDDLIYHCYFPGHLRAFKKSALNRTRFNPALKAAEDWDFLLSIYPFIKRIHIPQELYSYRINQNGISITNHNRAIQESISLLQRHIAKNDIYKGKKPEIIPTDAGNNIVYYDHLVDGKSTMKPRAKEVLLRYLRDGY